MTESYHPILKGLAQPLEDLGQLFSTRRSNTSGAGLPYDNALAVANKLYETATKSLRSLPQDGFYRHTPKKLSEKWPYDTAIRFSVGLFRLLETLERPSEDGRYGLAVRVQTPTHLREKIATDLRALFERFGLRCGMPVTFKLIHPIIARAASVGASVGCSPMGYTAALGSLTLFVKIDGKSEVLGLTAAHALERPAVTLRPGDDVYCPFPENFDPAQHAANGKIKVLRPLVADPIRTDYLPSQLTPQDSVDAALIEYASGQLPTANGRRAIDIRDLARVKAPIEPATLYDLPKRLKALHSTKVSAMSGPADLRLSAVGEAVDIYIPGIGCRAAANVTEFTVLAGTILPGDSGALIVDYAGAALGMVIAHSPEAKLNSYKTELTCYAVPITSIFQHMGLSLA